MRFIPWFVLLVAATVTHPREADARVFTPKVILAGHKDGGRAVCFSDDGSLLATNGFKDGNVKLWDVATGHERATFKTGGNSGVRQIIAFTPEGSVLSVVFRPRKTGGRRETSELDLLVLDPDPDTAKARTLSIAVPDVNSIAYSPDGKTLAVSSWHLARYGTQDVDSGRLAFLDPATGRVRATLMEGRPFNLTLAFSRDGSTLATGGSDGYIRLWDVKTAKKLATLHDSAHWNGTRPSNPLFSPDGKYIASLAEDNTVRVWYLSSLDPIVTLKGFRGPLSWVAYSPNGKLLAVACHYNQTLTLFDAKTFVERAKIDAHDGGFGAAAFSPDGKLLAVSCVDKTLTLWDAKTLVERAKIDAHDGGFTGAMIFSPDGKLVATRSGDGIVKIWELSHLLSGGSPAPVPAPASVKTRSGDHK